MPEHNVTILYLSVWDKLFIIAMSAAFLFVVLLCMVCVLSPYCPLYNYCCFSDEDEERKKKRKGGSFVSTSSYGSTDSPYVSPDGTDPGSKVWSPLSVIKECDTSDWSSDTSGHDILGLTKEKQRERSGSVLSNGSVSEQPPETKLETGEIEFSLKYNMAELKLTVHVLEVRDLQLSDMTQLISPYIKIRLYRAPKQLFTFGGQNGKDHVINNLDKEMKTKMQRPSNNLVYKESFAFDIEAHALKQYTVQCLLCDMDRFSRHVVFGETTVSLKKAELSHLTEVTYIEHLCRPEPEDLGEINVGLSYLPTSEKMYLTVNWIRGLKVMDKKRKTTDPCVKAYLMYEGKQLKRARTMVKYGELNPSFEDSFCFDVPQQQLGNVYFIVAVSHVDKEKKSSKLIGRIYLGQNFEPAAQEHWRDMMLSPRKQIDCWHKIVH